ncbi:DASH complex subunit dam1 [Aspergillus niger]|nr:DASH complex subunit dam1 [Aspergillus niger]GKZ64297.1 DASH complex subunit dam1 [Aspergillus niger]GLA00699.1 DASH complex subunit dam1 [Aspergillus niger]GLA20199.1 DASH complex subunit dam1 [Aspergillus niger]GLA36358.1 DASH complex subunit dam1 [Aspergillus niger]
MDAFSRSSSRPRPSSRPTTPLRPSSRSSIREAHGYGNSIGMAGYTQPAINALEPQFAELADSMADLEANFMHLQLMHESLTRFSESFASFLYGLNMNAFCVDFPEDYGYFLHRTSSKHRLLQAFGKNPGPVAWHHQRIYAWFDKQSLCDTGHQSWRPSKRIAPRTRITVKAGTRMVEIFNRAQTVEPEEAQRLARRERFAIGNPWRIPAIRNALPNLERNLVPERTYGDDCRNTKPAERPVRSQRLGSFLRKF